MAGELETVVAWSAQPLKLGIGATREVGADAAAAGITRALVVADEGVAATGLPERVRAHLADAGIASSLCTDVRIEPTDRSVLAAAARLDPESFDGIVAVGGGSTIDTAKAIALFSRHPGDVLRYAAWPTGAGEPVPGPLPPIVALPTTAGTGSETTVNCILDLRERHTKIAIAHPHLRPRAALVDPENTLTMPPAVTRSSGYDVLVQALESWTTLPYDRRPRPAHPSRRPAYVGANPISDVWTEKALALVGASLVRAVQRPDDLEARVGMCRAAAFARLGTAGAHVPHALGYPIAGLVREYRPPGFGVDHPLVPHGISVVVTAAAAFELTQEASPERHARAAELLGAAPGQSLPERLRELVAATGGPTGLRELGYGEDDVGAIVTRALEHERLLVGAPLPVGRAELERVVRASL